MSRTRSSQAGADRAEGLLELAREKFGTLTEAEEKLFEAATKGEFADYSAEKEEDNDPARADKWPDERVLKADRLVWLCTDPAASALVTYRGVLVRGARIEGQLDLVSARIPFPLYFERSALPQGITLRDAEVRALYLSGTHTGPITADRLKVGGDVFLRGGFRAEGEVRLLGATIGGNLDCRNGKSINPGGDALSADGLKVGGDVFLRDGFRAEGTVRLLGATIGGDLGCGKGEFINRGGHALSADRLKVVGAVFLGDGFRAEGEVRLLGAAIGGNLDCGNGEFINPASRALSADRLKVGSSVFLQDGFRADGEVRLLGAAIGGSLQCSNGQFINPGGHALGGDGLKVVGDVFLRDGFRAEGEVRLLGATIGGNLDCRNGEFINPGGTALSAERLKVEGNVFLRNGFEAKGSVSLLSAVINGYFVWTGVASPGSVTLDLRSARVGTLWDERKSWPGPDRLFIHGLQYEQIHDAALMDAESRIGWLRRQPTDRFSSQPYEQLAEVLRKSGYDADARKILIAKAKDRARLGQLSFSGRAWHRLLGLTVGYGYRPSQAVWFVLGIVIMGWVLFAMGFRAGVMTPMKDRTPKFTALVYSLDTFVPLVDLHQASYWLPDADLRGGSLLRWYLWLHTAAGWALTTLLAVALGGLVRR